MGKKQSKYVLSIGYDIISQSIAQEKVKWFYRMLVESRSNNIAKTTFQQQEELNFWFYS